MDIDLLRTIDRFVGQVAQLLLIALVELTGLFRAPRASRVEDVRDVRRIVIFKFFGMGSLLLASPAMRKLKARFPGVELVLFTLESNRRLCEILPAIDRVVCLDLKNFRRTAHSFLGYLDFVRKNPVDLSFDFEFLTKFSANVTLLTRLVGATRHAIGFHCPLSMRNRSFDTCVIFDHSLHISEIYTKMINVACGDNDLAFDFTEESRALRAYGDPSILERLRERHPALAACARLVAININTGPLSHQRRWPLDSFRRVIEGLLAHDGVGMLLIGGPDDRAFVAGFCRTLPATGGRVVDVAGITTVPELIGLFTRIDLLVCNDSGPLHYAHVVGLPTVSFFGPETPRLYGPVGPGHRVFYLNVSCSPCLNVFNSKMSTCTNNICLQQVPPDQVIAAVETLLFGAAGDGAS
ncbi:MAG: glycosyltransferase family 9 protein [Magnetococcales bacterium]|nr:glycosyltransferase family 9 protein [Magnetococcales bacterium]